MSFFCYLCSVLVNQMFNFKFSDFMKSKEFSPKDIEDFFVNFLSARMGISILRTCVNEGALRLLSAHQVRISIYFPSFFVVSAILFRSFEWIEFWDFEYIKQSDELKLEFICNKNGFDGVWK